MKRKKKSWKKRKAIWEYWELKKKDYESSLIKPTKVITVPYGAIAADLEILVANNNTYGPLPYYYKDIKFTCKDCGNSDIYTAAQQKWWFEVAKGHIHSTASRCTNCRANRKAAKVLQKQRMEAMAKKEPHPNEAFFKRRTKKLSAEE